MNYHQNVRLTIPLREEWAKRVVQKRVTLKLAKSARTHIIPVGEGE